MTLRIDIVALVHMVVDNLVNVTAAVAGRDAVPVPQEVLDMVVQNVLRTLVEAGRPGRRLSLDVASNAGEG